MGRELLRDLQGDASIEGWKPIVRKYHVRRSAGELGFKSVSGLDGDHRGVQAGVGQRLLDQLNIRLIVFQQQYPKGRGFWRPMLLERGRTADDTRLQDGSV